MGEMATALDRAMRLQSKTESIVALGNALTGELQRLAGDIGAAFKQP
jgi:hypothetical protein